jgi:hypothetical protein
MGTFAVALPAAGIPFDLELALLLGAGLLLVSFGLYAVLEVRRRFRQTDEPAMEPTQSLDHYQELRDQGLLEAAEFERIKLALEGRKRIDERIRAVDRQEKPPNPPSPLTPDP